MPIYEYHCQKCGSLYEQLVRLDQEPELLCPLCGSTEVKKAFSLFGSVGANTGSSGAESVASSCAPSG